MLSASTTKRATPTRIFLYVGLHAKHGLISGSTISALADPSFAYVAIGSSSIEQNGQSISSKCALDSLCRATAHGSTMIPPARQLVCQRIWQLIKLRVLPAHNETGTRGNFPRHAGVHGTCFAGKRWVTRYSHTAMPDQRCDLRLCFICSHRLNAMRIIRHRVKHPAA